MKIGQPEPQREVDACHAGRRNVLGYELPLRKNGVVLGKFVFCVGRFVRIDLSQIVRIAPKSSGFIFRMRYSVA